MYARSFTSIISTLIFIFHTNINDALCEKTVAYFRADQCPEWIVGGGDADAADIVKISRW